MRRSIRRKGSGLGDQDGEKLAGAVTRIRRGGAGAEDISYECEEASIIVRTDALIAERPIVGWVLHNLEVRLSTVYEIFCPHLKRSHLASVLHQLICIVEFVECIRRETERFRE